MSRVLDLWAGMTGVVQDFAGTTAPDGWLLCDGQAVSREDYENLFAVIGTEWGDGDGSTTFNVPDLRGRVPVGAGQGEGLTDRTLGDTGGEETHTLTEGEMPAHSHTGTAASAGAHTHSFDRSTDNDDGASVSAGSNLLIGDKSTSSAGAHTHTLNINDAGNGEAHNIMQPYAVLNKIIKT